MEKSACTYPRTSFKRSVNGIRGTVNQYIALNSLMIVNMTSYSATKENTEVSSIITDWHKISQH
jgi:hypothetical protein